MERLAKLIKILSGSQGFVTIDDLAQDLGVTTRTVRSDLLMLEQALEGSNVKIVKRRNQGITLDRQNLSERAILNLIALGNRERDFYSASERENLLGKHFFWSGSR